MGTWFRVGKLQLLAVSDGTFWIDAGIVFGAVPRVMWEPLVKDQIDDQHRIPMGLNCLAIRTEKGVVLVETGIGNKGRAPVGMRTDQAGILLQELAKEGIRRDEVIAVINTHLHFDHCGNNTVLEEGKLVPTFPRARYFVQKGEWEDAHHLNERTRSAYFPEHLEPLEEARLVEVVEGEAEIAPGIRMVPAPGHTPHHVIVEVESEGEMLIHTGDLTHHPVGVERFAWLSAFDVLPLVNMETKRRIVSKAIEKRAILMVAHAPYPGLGLVRLEEGRRRWQPLEG